MELEHRFTVPVGVDEAWAHFQDIASVAECFPGAQVTDHAGDTFHGSVKVKLGPIALLYNGTGTFTEKDDVAHRFVVDAKGKDKRGNGTAGAKVTLAMTGTTEATDVAVHTDLAITGKPAQFGRGVMQDVSDKLLGQFVACLEQRLGEEGTPAGAMPPATDHAPGPGAGAAPAEAAPASPPPPAATAPEESGPEVTASAPAPPPAPAPAGSPPAASSVTSTSARGSGRGSDDALDLGKTVLPVLAKAYWKQALVVLVVVVVVIWLIAR